ncbi:MAG TPA: flagellar hook-basal body complex protein FliE [Acetobacteraceae bacterium]
MTPIAVSPAGIPTITVTPQAAADTYQRTDAGAAGGDANSFGATLERAVGAAVAQGHAADQQAAAAISGGGDITQVVTSLARAQLTLQTATAIRDRVVSAYQQIMQMPI